MYKQTVKIMYSDMWRSFSLQNVEINFEWRMMSRNWSLSLSDDPDILIYSCFGNNYLKYDCPRIFFTPENVRPNFNHCDYAFSFDYPITERNYRLPFFRRLTEYQQLFNPRNPEQIIAENRNFCNILISNPNALERIDFFNALSKYKKVDSGGKLLNNIGGPLPPGRKNKYDWQRKYKFSIAFENSSYPGYTTEKLMDALIADTIPIYWGNPRASQDFNPKSFINCHDFRSFNEVVELVREIDNDESLYREYLSQPYLTGNVEPELFEEENIVARYNEILSTRKIFIPVKQKRKQYLLYYILEAVKTLRKLKQKFGIYTNHIIYKVKHLQFHA